MEDEKHKLNQPVDVSIFNKVVQVLALKVPNKVVSTTMNTIKPFVLQKKGKKNVYPCPESDDFKLVAITEELTEEDLKKKLTELYPGGNIPELAQVGVQYDYSDYNYHEALKMLLPSHIVTPNGYETIGHIAHLNLKEPQFPYKYLIGQVIKDKTKEITTVVNKLDKLSNEFRTPELELISGEKNYEAKILEEKCNLFVDFEKVYWCSRLHGERSRVIQTLKQKDVICDAFCGVGPFAVRAAKEKGCRVYASDLNPFCYEYLLKNAKVNKVDHLVEPSCGDARKFIYDTLMRVYKGEILPVTRYFMNLPGDAIEFLDAFPKFFKENPEYLKEEVFKPSTVHVYCFLGKADEISMREDLTNRVQKVLPNFDQKDIDNVHTLKSVSSEKDMCCLTFWLTTENADHNQPGKAEKMLKTE
jgi:tRNA (guanine37-N1)-methyltransferase